MNSITHKYVEYIPATLDEGVVYISKKYKTMVHKCCCGCGNEVVTPMGKTDWQLTEETESISIYPSIGNWGFKCKSHYWINKNRVLWSDQWSEDMIKAGRRSDRLKKEAYYKNESGDAYPVTNIISQLLQSLKNWWNNLF